jgi:CheY-like chemotaxis protein
MSEAIYTILICLVDHGFVSRTKSKLPRSTRMWRITLLVGTECVMFRLHTVPILGRNTEQSLLRISMPVMNGYEATVRTRKSGVRLLIIVITAYARKGDMELCLEKGVDDYIAKPVNRQLLMRKLIKWLAAPMDADGGRQEFP